MKKDRAQKVEVGCSTGKFLGCSCTFQQLEVCGLKDAALLNSSGIEPYFQPWQKVSWPEYKYRT